MDFFSVKDQLPGSPGKCSMCHKEIAPADGTFTTTLNRPVHTACLPEAAIAEHFLLTQIFRNHDPKGNNSNVQ